MLLLPYSISSSTLESDADLLLSYPTTILALHNPIILIMTHLKFQQYPKLAQNLSMKKLLGTNERRRIELSESEWATQVSEADEIAFAREVVALRDEHR